MNRLGLSPARPELVLEAALRTIAPLVKLLLREGVTHGRLATALKTSFLEAAPELLEASSVRVTDSSISTLTGVHRKDVREWRTVGQTLPQARAPGAAMAVFTRWVTDPAYCDKRGRPRALSRVGGAASFEALADTTCNDVHPRTILQELMRLGVVRAARSRSRSSRDVDKVEVCMDAFVPPKDTAEMLRLLSDNVADHLAAAIHNVSGGTPMLEQSVFADTLTPQSADALGVLARRIWMKALQDIARQATDFAHKDVGSPDANRRIRVGMYFYHAPQGSGGDSGPCPD